MSAAVDVKWKAVLMLTALKLLLIPSYRSTDFEVHRNWLAITGSMPIPKWYTENTSEWTLDYPPLFAWFEWALSQLAQYVDPAMLKMDNLNYASPETILFQRLSVVVTDGVLLSAAWFGTHRYPEPRRTAAFLLLAANAGLLIVDHIHFQYNGMLLGLLLWSVVLIREGRDLLGGLLFAALLHMKHLFACLAPLYFVYLLRHYCRGQRAVQRFLLLGALVAAVFAVSLGPFVAAGQLPQVLNRLFPFKRGLMHAYWAANLWALYAAVDRALALALPRLGLRVQKPTALMTGGLVQVSSFAFLPNIEAPATLAVVLLTMLPMLVAVWRGPRPEAFARAAAYACLCSFMAGYHVHEKAILMVCVPLALDAVHGIADARAFMSVSVTGHFALLPLLFTRNEYPIKMLIFLAYSVGSCALLRACISEEHPEEGARASAAAAATPAASAPAEGRSQGGAPSMVDFLGGWNVAYFGGMAALEAFCVLLHPLLLPRLQFLPLLLTSVYCALGLTKDWVCLMQQQTSREQKKVM